MSTALHCTAPPSIYVPAVAHLVYFHFSLAIDLQKDSTMRICRGLLSLGWVNRVKE
jgi:hypothetical protein